MIIDIGGGTSEVAVISLGGIVATCSARVGAINLTKLLRIILKENTDWLSGIKQPRKLKLKSVQLYLRSKKNMPDVRGRDLTGGLPKMIKVSSNRNYGGHPR